MVNIVISFPLEICPPVAKAAPILFFILNSGKTPNLNCQLSKKVFTSPDMLDQYTGEPMTIASEENKSSAVTCPTRLSTTVVPARLFAPSTTASAMRSVLPDCEWYATNTLTAVGADSAADTRLESSAMWDTSRQKTRRGKTWCQLRRITD